MSQWNCQLVVRGWNLLPGLKQLSVSISEYRLHINYIPTVINAWGKIYKKLAKSHGETDSCEQICMNLRQYCTMVTFIVDFAMTIWGSVVVFGAWASWTWKWEEYNNNTDDMNFCEYTPMVFAFVLLIFKWVSTMIRATNIKPCNVKCKMC